MKLVIIDYGAGNTKSVQFAFKRLGCNAILSNIKDEILSADKIIFPGVGQARNAMERLKATELDTIIPILKQPVLGICLGMQLLCNHSDEGDTNGFGIFNVNVKRFPTEVKVPQIGWNTINKSKLNLFHNLKAEEYMYFVHSFYAELCNDTISETHYGLTYSSALQKNNFYGVQFHPEKSSKAGEQLLSNFLDL